MIAFTEKCPKCGLFDQQVLGLVAVDGVFVSPPPPMRVMQIVALRKNDASRTMERARSILRGGLQTKQTAFENRRVSEGIDRSLLRTRRVLNNPH